MTELESQLAASVAWIAERNRQMRRRPVPKPIKLGRHQLPTDYEIWAVQSQLEEIVTR